MKYYTIDSDKLAAVTRIVNQDTDPRATEDLIETQIRADWYEGAAHQSWLDNAKPAAIANWIAAFYGAVGEE